MKKQLLTLLLVMAGMVSWAQSGSGWTNPGNAYQQQTVVYAILNFGDGISVDMAPEVAAFIDGEVRAVTSNFQMNDIGNIYTMRIGGEDADIDKAVQFKVYDPMTGLIYPLEVTDETGAPSEVTYQGDYTYREQDETTGGYRVIRFNLSATPVEGITVEYKSEDNPVVPLKVGEETTVEDYVTFKFETASGAEPTMPENPLVWNLDRVDNSGNATSYYLSVETNSDGFNIATGLNKTNGYAVTAGVTIGNGNLGANVDFIVTQPVTSIKVADAEIYLGVGRFVPQPVFNGGESEPNNTGFTLSVETEGVVRVVDQAIIPQALGTAVVTATSEENPEISTTFRVTVISALQSIDKGFDTDVYEYTRWSDGEELIDLPNPGFIWLTNEDGNPVINVDDIDYSYTITSSDPEVIRIDEQVTDNGTVILPVSLKKGTAQITYTSNYDPSKSVTFTVVVKQGITGVRIAEVNGEAVDFNSPETPSFAVWTGKANTAKIEVLPADADFDPAKFNVQFQYVESGNALPSEPFDVNEYSFDGNVCTYNFTFKSDNDYVYQSQSLMLFAGIPQTNYQNSVEIEVRESLLYFESMNNQTTYEFYMDSIGGDCMSSLDLRPYPTDAYDVSLTMESENPEVVEVEYDNYEIYGNYYNAIFKTHSRGKTSVTIKSVSNPELTFTINCIIKQAVNKFELQTINGEEISKDEYGNVELDYVYNITQGDVAELIARLTPADADISNAKIALLLPKYDSEGDFYHLDTVQVSEVSIVDGEVIGSMTMPDVPEHSEGYIEKMVELDYPAHNAELAIVCYQGYNRFHDAIKLNILPTVESIDVYMNEEYWITEDENIFEFKYNVNPGNVLDPSLTVESSNSDVAEVLMSEDAGMYRIHAYSTGEVTFTFTSVSNPEVSTQVTTVIKRAPTGVAITKVGSIDIPEPGTTPAETVVEVAVGQDVVAVAGIEPNDATYDSFEFELVNDDDIPYEADVVAIGDLIDNGDGTISLGFTFNSVPDRDVYLKAVARYTKNDEIVALQHRIRIEVRQGVTDIAVSEDVKTIWFTQDMVQFFTIQATVSPDDATNKQLEVSIDGEGVVELVGESEEVENEYRFSVVGKGTATITFTSVDNPSVSATCTVTVKKRVTEMYFEGDVYDMYNDGEVHHGTLTFYPEDADFNIDNLKINVNANDLLPENWVAAEVNQLDMTDGLLQLEIVPRALCQFFSIEFIYAEPTDEGTDPLMQSVEGSIREKVTLGSGWSWVSFISAGVRVSEIGNALVEARSREQLVFNDAAWGLFGDLSWMDQSQAYKLNIKDQLETGEVVLYPMEGDGATEIAPKSFDKGWNWVSYPYEFGYAVEDIFAAANFSENDMILSKDGGFMQRNAAGEWEGSLTELVPNQGYMIYCNADIEQLDMPGRYDLPQGYFVNSDIPRAASRERAVWVYDNSRFANTMAVVAKVDVENTDDYTIGAFVGEECRGEGKFINGKAFISVGGESGDVVTFRLYNKWTEEFTDITTEVMFTDMAGSIKAPLSFGLLEGTTGIVDINTIDRNNVEAIYDITGRKVEQMTEGIYVIKVREGDKIVTKKVRK